MSPIILCMAQTGWDHSWIVSYFVRLEWHTRPPAYSKTGRMPVVFRNRPSLPYSSMPLSLLWGGIIWKQLLHKHIQCGPPILCWMRCGMWMSKSLIKMATVLMMASWGGGAFCSGARIISFIFLPFSFILLATVQLTNSWTIWLFLEK